MGLHVIFVLPVNLLNNQHPDYIVFPSNQRIAIGDDKDPAEFTVRWFAKIEDSITDHIFLSIELFYFLMQA